MNTGGDYSFWIEPARRGLFGFDWKQRTNGAYARLTIPSRTITVDDLTDTEVQRAALLVRLPVDFHHAASIDSDAMAVDLYNGPFFLRR